MMFDGGGGDGEDWWLVVMHVMSVGVEWCDDGGGCGSVDDDHVLW